MESLAGNSDFQTVPLFFALHYYHYYHFCVLLAIYLAGQRVVEVKLFQVNEVHFAF